MKRQPVKSSNLVSVGFEGGVLEIEFLGGKVYRYDSVPETMCAKLIAAKSIGKFFHAHIMPTYTAKLVK